jgi:hypothetical protein
MKAKRLLLAIAALAIAGALWLTQTHREPVPAETKADTRIGAGLPEGQPTPAHQLRAPDPNRRFRELTPEQRVQFARKPFGVGG